jgi:hypothetical protein
LVAAALWWLLVSWAPGLAGDLLPFARLLPGLGLRADGLAALGPETGARQAVVLYLAVWWLTLPVKAVCAYLEQDALQLQLGRTADPVTARSVLYTLVGTPLAWGTPAALFSIVGRKLASGEAGLTDPLSLQLVFLVGSFVNGPLTAWAEWSFYAFVIALLSTRFLEIADIARRRIAARTIAGRLSGFRKGGNSC